MRLFRWVALVALVCSLLPGKANAQVDSGRISGIVRDSSGGLVPHAKITVRNEKTGDSRTVETNADGYFIVGPLKPSTYTVTAEMVGFANILYDQMPLAVAQELSLDFEFKPAGVQENVTVIATSPVLDVSGASLGANISEREVGGLPVNGRQMSQLMLQAPGSQNAGDGTWQDIRFSGRANEQNVIKYDGIEGSAIIDASPGNANGENKTPFKLQASLENVQEFRVESSGYSAEFGTGTGGQVSVITKSGGNLFHGSLFEYFRNDALDARNHFDSLREANDSITSEGPQSTLGMNQFGGSFGGPIAKNKAFFFVSYEGYRLDAGKNIVEAVPSDLAWSRAVAAVQPLRPGFLSPDAVILAGQSSNPLLEVAQLQDEQRVRENSFAGRFDVRVNDKWSAYARVFHDQGTNDDPNSVSGRRLQITANPTNAVFNLQGLLGAGGINEFKFGYNAAPTTIGAAVTDPVMQGIIVNVSGSVANAGIAGQGGSSGLTVPGGLVRVNSAGNGRGAPYDPYSLTFADTYSRVIGNHLVKMGGDARLIRMSTDQLGGITYTYQSLDLFLQNSPQGVQYFGDLSEPSPFNNGASGLKHIRQEYYVGYLQDEWRVRQNFTLNYGLRYDYYVPLTEVDNRIVKFNIETGVIDPNTTPFYQSRKDSFQPRVSATFLPASRTVLKGGGGIFVGPGQTEDQIQPVEAERISTSVSAGSPINAYPVDPALIRLNFTNNPNNRSYQPRAYSDDYTLPERVYQYTGSVQQELPGSFALSAAYVGAQGRNLFLRSIANRTIGVELMTNGTWQQIREFDILTRNASGALTAIQRPYAEIDYKTSGGHDTYNSMQLSLTRRAIRGVTMNAQYTLGSSRGNTGGSNEAVTAGNNARAIEDFEYDDGYNNFDVRHTFNLSALYNVPGTGAFTGGWTVGTIFNARSGLPIPVTITRPDIVYVDGAGNVYNNAAADRVGVVNVPGGGASRSTRRPNLIEGVNPFIEDGGLLFLNPAAFSTPAPGTFGNLERNSIHGPSFKQIDLVVSKRVKFGGATNGEFRLEVFNILNTTNFALPPAVLGNALPNASTTTEANRLQPGQAYTQAAAGQTFGRLGSTVQQTVGLGTNRQIQLAFRLTF